MKKMFLLLLIFGFISSVFAGKKINSAPSKTDAGVDQTFYLTQTSRVTLNSSASTVILMRGLKFTYCTTDNLINSKPNAIIKMKNL